MSEATCYREERVHYGNHMALVEVMYHARELIHHARFLENLRGSHGIENLARQIYREHNTQGKHPNFSEVLRELQGYRAREDIPEIIGEVEQARLVLESLVGTEASVVLV
ncbi:hypothetical protein HYT57_01455 [Candidatus Woesearchaeota archaeon]|nr:hypothetical protein [Candidatus Woesearchaeota archaeon]